MLIAIVLLFISCNTLAFVCNIMENLDEVRFLDFYGTFYLYEEFLEISWILVNSSSR